MISKLICFSLFLLPLSVFAGVFSADHTFESDPKCVISGSADSAFGKRTVNRPIRCAVQKKKPELSFCEGDEVSSAKGIRMNTRVFLILDKKETLFANAPSNASKEAKMFTDNVEQVNTRYNCQERLKFLSKFIFDIAEREKLNHK